MEWNDEEIPNNTKKGMSLSSKVLLGMIACIVLIIILLVVLLMNTNKTVFRIYVNGNNDKSLNKDTLLATIDNVTYVNIEEFSKIVGYEYHKGEYKSSKIVEDKCYVEGTTETASFYLNDNKVYKLPVNKQDLQYDEYTIENPVRSINNKMYASTEAISKAFNVLLDLKSTEFQIYTLDYLITIYDAKVKQWGYVGLVDQSLENKKALLQGVLIVNKSGGMYKVIDSNNTKEITLARYTAINYSDSTEEFFVTDSSKKVGILNLDGTTKIEPAYDSISILDKKSNLYIVEQSKEYGVVTGNGSILIYPEYTNIGLTNSKFDAEKYLMLDNLIPVCKDRKWGAFDKEGNLVIDTIYDDFGYSLTSVEINGVREPVEPVLTIKRANGIVVKSGDKYGLIDITGKELVPVAVDAIYAINGVEDEKEKYFMLYNWEEINLIKRLIDRNIIEDDNTDTPIDDEIIANETITDNTIINNIENGTLNNNIDM